MLPVEKTVNRVKAKIEARRSPVEKDQGSVRSPTRCVRTGRGTCSASPSRRIAAVAARLPPPGSSRLPGPQDWRRRALAHAIRRVTR
jgi:hypothetical protein